MTCIFSVVLNAVTYDIRAPNTTWLYGTPTATARLIVGGNVVTNAHWATAYPQLARFVHRYTPGGAVNYLGNIMHIEQAPTANCGSRLMANLIQVDKTGAFNIASTQYVEYLGWKSYDTGTIAQVYGLTIEMTHASAGALALGGGIQVSMAITPGDTVTTFFGLQSSITNTGSLGTGAGMCLNIDSSTKVTNYTHLFIGDTYSNLKTNRWSIYIKELYNNYIAGPTINCAMSKEDDFDSTITWSVGAAAAGVQWRLTLAGAGAIAQVANARGGIISITSTIATPSWLDEYANNGWSVQDYPVLYARFRTLETVNTMKAVGFTDAVNAGANLPYTTNGLMITVDTSIGAFFYLTGIVAGGRVNSPGPALDTNSHTFMILPKYLPATGAFDGYELWMDGVVTAAVLTAAQCPAVGTMMQALPAYAGNLAGAVMSTIYVDVVKFSQRRNTGTAA